MKKLILSTQTRTLKLLRNTVRHKTSSISCIFTKRYFHSPSHSCSTWHCKVDCHSPHTRSNRILCHNSTPAHLSASARRVAGVGQAAERPQPCSAGRPPCCVLRWRLYRQDSAPWLCWWRLLLWASWEVMWLLSVYSTWLTDWSCWWWLLLWVSWEVMWLYQCTVRDWLIVLVMPTSVGVTGSHVTLSMYSTCLTSSFQAQCWRTCNTPSVNYD